MYLIQAFWFVAVGRRGHDRDLPRGIDLLARAGRPRWSRSAGVLAWLMNRWSLQVAVRVERDDRDARRLGLCEVGQSAVGSLPAMMIALAWAWMAAWIEGSWAAAVSCVPLLTTTLPPSAPSAFLMPLSAITSYGLMCVLRDRVDDQTLLDAVAGGRDGHADGGQADADREADDRAWPPDSMEVHFALLHCVVDVLLPDGRRARASTSASGCDEVDAAGGSLISRPPRSPECGRGERVRAARR